MKDAILITQCLQNDFVELIDKYDPIPNLLHVGYEEAKRLLGEKIEEGPVNTLMEWAYDSDENSLEIIHIRDWHNRDELSQADHLSQFGEHCIANTRGAEFVFSSRIKPERKHRIVNASGLNDFVDTDLEEALSPFQDKKCRVGVVGVWTEAKINFLCYELKTRYPNFEIATCSPVTASSNRANHFIALESLQKILGIRVFTSLSEFTGFLNGTAPALEKRITSSQSVRIQFEDNYSVSDTDMKILQYLFRDLKEVSCKCLDGGFSGNVVLKSSGKDIYGHRHVPYVIKIGPRDPISKERISFEKIQEVLGNNAPSIVDFAELENRGAIKYRYASMLDGNVRTFQKYYKESEDLTKIEKFLHIVYREQLGRLYDAGTREPLNLLKYYDFQSKYAEGVRTRVNSILDYEAKGDRLTLHGIDLPNVVQFYSEDLNHLKEKINYSRYVSYLHGDLNGANIIIDSQENVWLIDFFHTHKGHILKDLIKLENDILYIFMNIENEYEFKEAAILVENLINVYDLGIPFELPNQIQFSFPKILKAYKTIQILRSYYRELIALDRDPYQLWVGLMRYAMHTLSFDESNLWQKKLALLSGCLLSEKIKETLNASSKLRIDFLFKENEISKGNIGLTILPGRKDRNRKIEKDLKSLSENGISAVVSLVTEDELEEYGVKDLRNQYKSSSLDTNFLPILDQGVPDKENMNALLEWIHNKVEKGEKVLIHCVGGLGRSGTVAACYLIRYHSKDPVEAIHFVRERRSRRAVESRIQEEFILNFK